MGNFLVLNLFLALLLNSFSCEELKSRKEVSSFDKNPIEFLLFASFFVENAIMQLFVNVELGSVGDCLLLSAFGRVCVSVSR